MNLDEYSSLDATGLAALIKAGQVTTAEVAALARDAVAMVDESLNAVAQGPFDEPLG